MRKKSLAIALALLMCFSVVGQMGQDASLEESPSGEEVSEVETDVTEEGEDAGLPEQVMGRGNQRRGYHKYHIRRT